MTVEELYGQMVDTFQRETGLALAGDGDMAVRLYAVAAQLYALYVQADWVGRQCFPQTAQGDYLDKHAQLRGLERRAATAAVIGGITAVASAGACIPSGIFAEAGGSGASGWMRGIWWVEGASVSGSGCGKSVWKTAPSRS